MLLPLLFLPDRRLVFSSPEANVFSNSHNIEGQLSSKCRNPSDCITSAKQKQSGSNSQQNIEICKRETNMIK
jgi:hypothetical protein